MAEPIARKPFRFGAGIPGILARGKFIDTVREIESLGYSTMLLSDHLVDQFAPFSALGLAAGVTSRLRLGMFVLNNDLRHPAVLAQELATLDQLSEGRLEIGIGAGWNRPEYDSAGMTFDSSATRIERMGEAVAVLKGLFGENPIDFRGRYYQVKGLEDLPRPAQRPHPPLMIGGGGRKTLSFAAREASIVGLAPRAVRPGLLDVASCMAAGTAQKIEWVKAAAGSRFDQLEFNTYPSLNPVSVTNDPSKVAHEIADRLKRRFDADLSEDDILDSPHVFVGSIESLVDKCLGLRERFGITYIFVGGEFREFAPVVERLAGR
ncbi:MAG TPA: TIGR03621 family F420-dependent LLM class oxidoreductase [Candidatus Dormibacteraeota bacterium]